MKQLLNILYVTSPDAYIAADGMNIVVTTGDQSMCRPVHIFESIVCFGYRGLSPGAIRLCAENDVTVYFVNEFGKYIGSIYPPTHGNVLLRKAQYRWSDDEQKSAVAARNIVAAKIMNARKLIRDFLKDHPEKGTLGVGADSLYHSAQAVIQAEQLDQIRGIEGMAAKQYFVLFDHMLLADKEHFFFNERNRRPPLDPVNALLSFFYSMIALEARSALECVGIDPFVGMLHRDRPGRASLALDLTEELRSFMAEKTVLNLINRRQIQSGDFVVKENGAVLLKENARKGILTCWHERKQKEIIHPYLKEKIKIGLIPFVQASLLGKFFRGEIAEYPPFRWR